MEEVQVLLTDKTYYDNLKDELEPILNQIKTEVNQLLMLKKPILTSEAKYANRITACIMRYCNKNRQIKHMNDIMDYYSKKELMEWEYQEILDINYFINCEKGVDYLLSKKTICMLLGLSIEQYQEFMLNNFESSDVFRNIEESLIAIKQESAEAFNRNAVAVDTNLKVKGKYGGHDVEMKNEQIANQSQKKFNALEATVEEITQHLNGKYGNLLDKK